MGLSFDPRRDVALGATEMAKSYRITKTVRMVNKAAALSIRRGWGRDYTYLLTTTGRTSGLPRTNPVDVMADRGRRWLVAPYGETNWVKNARALGEATLSRDGVDETVRLVELPISERVPVLRMYLEHVRIVRPYFDVTTESSDEEFLVAAPGHPVFRIEPSEGGTTPP
jgi:deazaflavin-dependent oxidoreductase (nitroreductase family)